MNSSSKVLAPAIATVALLLLTLGTYTAGYFWLGTYSRDDGVTVIRVYDSKAVMFFFAPAAAVESSITRHPVKVAYRSN